jgi:hypothetical protein
VAAPPLRRQPSACGAGDLTGTEPTTSRYGLGGRGIPRRNRHRLRIRPRVGIHRCLDGDCNGRRHACLQPNAGRDRGRVLLAGLALALVPVVFWPIGKRYNETLAVGYVVFRGAIETIFYIVTALGWLLLIALSKEADAGPLASFVRTTETVIWDQVIAIPFVLGALMFYVVLYESRLVPRWLSIWGLVGAALYIVAPLGSMFEVSLGFFMAPLALQEMVMAVWLIAKGFNPSSIAAESAGRTSVPRAAASGSAA